MNKLDALWLYQEAELELDKLESGLRATASRTKLNKLHAFLTEQQSQVASIQKQLETKKALIEKLSSRVAELEHNFELETSEFEMMKNDEECTAAELTESRSSIEGIFKSLNDTLRELTSAIAWIEKVTNEYKETVTKAGKAKKEYDSLKLICEEEIKKAQPDINKAKAEMEKRQKNVDAALLSKYNFVKTHHGVPMAKVANNQCGGCNMSLPTTVVKRVHASEGLVECENCGRILYAN